MWMLVSLRTRAGLGRVFERSGAFAVRSMMMPGPSVEVSRRYYLYTQRQHKIQHDMIANFSLPSGPKPGIYKNK
jgi:hypothetical protein